MAEGRYTKKADEIEYKESGNLPRWARDNPAELWQCADLFERKNGSTYREHIIGLPRELNQAQRMKLVKEWVVNEMGTNKPYSLAIHNTIASDGQEQPHLHLMFANDYRTVLSEHRSNFLSDTTRKTLARAVVRKTTQVKPLNKGNWKLKRNG